MYTLAFSGQFDRQLADFTHWLSKSSLNRCQMLGLANRKFPALQQLSWRTGSLVSAKDTSGMIDQVDALVYFCLTPPSALRTDEGFARDTALAAAVNIASAAQTQPNLRVVLVTRYFSSPSPKLGSCLDYWAQVMKIFQGFDLNLNIIQTDPVISELDAVSLAIFENAQQRFIKRNATQWAQICRPVSKRELYEAIFDAITCEEIGRNVHLTGANAVAFNDWLKASQLAIPFKHLQGRVTQMRTTLLPNNHLRAELLDELLEDARSASAPADSHGSSAFLRLLRHNADDILEEKAAGKPLLLEPEKSSQRTDGNSTCYVQRVLTRPHRSVSEIADLLTSWIPRYFQRLISADEMNASRVMCRFFRIPVMEFEKVIESPNRCRVIVRNPWALNMKKPANFIVTTTGTDIEPGVLLVIVEDAPHNKLILSSFRAMMIAFGRYLKEYGCGE